MSEKMSEKENVPISESAADSERGVSSVLPKQNAFQRLIHRRNDLNELGKGMLEQSLQYDRAQLEVDAVKVRWKLDLMVLPMVRFLSPMSRPL